jgi:hypothetical protein
MSKQITGPNGSKGSSKAIAKAEDNINRTGHQAEFRGNQNTPTGHHLRFNNKGQLMEITGPGITPGKGRSHAAAAR